MDEIEEEIIKGAMEDPSLIPLSTTSRLVAESLIKISKLVNQDLKFSHLISEHPYEFDRGIHFLVVGRLTPLGGKAPLLNTPYFEYTPLQLFEAVHYGAYDTANTTDFYRKMRGLKKIAKGIASSPATLEMRETVKQWNESRWTRSVLSVCQVRSAIEEKNKDGAGQHGKEEGKNEEKKEKIGGFASLFKKKDKKEDVEQGAGTQKNTGGFFSTK